MSSCCLVDVDDHLLNLRACLLMAAIIQVFLAVEIVFILEENPFMCELLCECEQTFDVFFSTCGQLEIM